MRPADWPECPSFGRAMAIAACRGLPDNEGSVCPAPSVHVATYLFAHANGFPRRPIASCSRPLRRNTGSRTWIGTDMIRVSRWTITGTTCSTSCSSSSKVCANRCGVSGIRSAACCITAPRCCGELYHGVVMLDSPLPTWFDQTVIWAAKRLGFIDRLTRPAARSDAANSSPAPRKRAPISPARRCSAASIPNAWRPTSNTGWSRRAGCACASIRRPRSASTAACRTLRPAGRPR